MVEVAIRPAKGSDTGVIASIWESGWREVHLGYVPEALARARTRETFVTRARDNIPHTIVATVNDSVLGFVVTVDDEVEQMYVDVGARSGSVASTLLGAAEATITAGGLPAGLARGDRRQHACPPLLRAVRMARRGRVPVRRVDAGRPGRCRLPEVRQVAGGATASRPRDR